MDESWIWQCLYLKQIVPWYQYVLKPASSRFEVNYGKHASLDADTRDLQELCTCLARHWPFVRQSDKPYDQIFAHLSEKVRLASKYPLMTVLIYTKFPHRSALKFQELYEKNMIPVSGCVGRLEKQFDAIFPPPESLHPVGSLVTPETTRPSNDEPSIPGLITASATDSFPAPVSRVNGKRAGPSTSTSLPRVGFQSGSTQQSAPPGDNRLNGSPNIGNSPAPMPNMDDTARSSQPTLNTNGPNSNATQTRGQPASVVRVNSGSHQDRNLQHNSVARDPSGNHPSLLTRGIGTTLTHIPVEHNVVAPTQLTEDSNNEVVSKPALVAINSTPIDYLQNGALVRPLLKRKRQLDFDFEDSESTENEDDDDFAETTGRPLSGNKRPRTDSQGAGNRGPRYTEEELDHLKQWIADHPHDNLRNTRIAYFTDFVKRVSLLSRERNVH